MKDKKIIEEMNKICDEKDPEEQGKLFRGFCIKFEKKIKFQARKEKKEFIKRVHFLVRKCVDDSKERQEIYEGLDKLVGEKLV